MNIDLIVIGKTDLPEISSLVEMYSKRISRYIKFSITYLPDIKATRKLPPVKQKEAEGEMLQRQLSPGDYVVLLDERGSEFRSVELAAWLDKRMSAGIKRLCFLVGGPYGFSDEIYARANDKISLSRMTFSHQLIRVIFAEQLYRAFTILGNEPYHND